MGCLGSFSLSVLPTRAGAGAPASNSSDQTSSNIRQKTGKPNSRLTTNAGQRIILKKLLSGVRGFGAWQGELGRPLMPNKKKNEHFST